MEPTLTAIGTIIGTIVPPAWEFIKTKWLGKGSSTPEQTVSSIAVSNPLILDKVVSAFSSLFQAKKEYFQRDISGEPSQWVVDLRAAIRPLFITIGTIMYVIGEIHQIPIPNEFCVIYGIAVGEWFGSRMI